MSPQPIKSVRKTASSVILVLFVALARMILWKYRPRVVGITGSVGKTTAKEAVYEALKGSFDVEHSRKNANTEWGVTASIIDPGFETTETASGKGAISALQMFVILIKGVWRSVFYTKYPEILVLELAADKPGDIHFFNQFLQYDVAVITGIGQVHLEFYENQEQLTQEKLALVSELKPGGLVVIDGDGPLTQDFIKETSVRKVTFGWRESNNYFAKPLGTSGATSKFLLKCQDREVEADFRSGRPTVLAVLIALAVGREFGLDCETLMGRLVKFTPPPGRFEIEHLKRGITLINDAYNANPDSMKLALISLQDIAGSEGEQSPAKPKRRRVAILGGMKELGSAHLLAHQEIGRFARDKADILIFIGGDGKIMADAAKDGAAQVLHFDEPNEGEIFHLLQDNDTVLVKASRVIGLDGLVSALKSKLS